MRRVVVIGTTGSGKSTLAERLSEQTGLRVVELDALFWGRDWQGAPVELFRHRVERETRDDGWIVVGNYSQVRDLVWRPADTLVWIDLPLSVVMWRLLRRTIRRTMTKEDLWGTGNREILRPFLLQPAVDPPMGPQDAPSKPREIHPGMRIPCQGEAGRAPQEPERG